MSVIAKNMAALFSTQLVTWTITAFVLIVAPRHLGPSDFGRLSFVWVYMGFFQLLAMMGSSTYLVKTIAREKEAIGLYLVNTLTMKLVVGGAMASASVLLGIALGYDRELIDMIAVAAAGMLLVVLNDTYISALQALDRIAVTAMWGVVGHVAGNAIGITMLITDRGPVLYLLPLSLGTLIPLAANTLVLRHELRGHARLDLGLWRRVARGGVPFLMWSGLLLIYGSIDVPLLRALADDATVGWYGLAYRWVSMPVFISTIVVTTMLPSLSSLWVSAKDAFASLANRGIRLVFFVSTPLATGIALVAHDLLTMLYQDEFDEAVPIMRILAFHIPVAAMDTVLGMTLIAADRQRRWVMVAAMAAVLNIVLNLPAIPLTVRLFDNGAIGAATTTVGTEVLMMLGAFALRPSGVLDRATLGFLLRTIVASAAMVPTVLLVDGAWLPVRILVGVVTFGIACIALGIVSIRRVPRRSVQSLDLFHLGREMRAPETLE